MKIYRIAVPGYFIDLYMPIWLFPFIKRFVRIKTTKAGELSGTSMSFIVFDEQVD